MSKRSRAKYESKDDAESTSVREAPGSGKSTISFTSLKEEDSISSTSSSACSSYYLQQTSSPRTDSRGGSSKQDSDNVDTNSTYLSNVQHIKDALTSKQLSYDYTEKEVQSPRLFSNDSDRYGRSPQSGRKLSSVCQLHMIEEKEEFSNTSKENSRSILSDELALNLSGTTSKNEISADTWSKNETSGGESSTFIVAPANSRSCFGDESERESCKTPRFYEVPPKKKCLRAKTPDFKATRPEADDVSKNANTKCGCRKYVIENRTFILRKLNSQRVMSVSTQASNSSPRKPRSGKTRLALDNLSIRDEPDRRPASSKSPVLYRRSQPSSSNSSSFKEAPQRNTRRPRSDNNVSLRINLPSSVIASAKRIPLEPNIIVLDTDRSKREKKKRKNFGRGDNSSDSEESPKHNLLNSRRVLNFKKYSDFTPDVTTISTPTYTVSPVLSERGNQTDSPTSTYLNPRYKNRIYSRTELEEREIRTIEPGGVGDIDCLNEGESLKSLRSLIGNFAEGVEATRSFPENFEDIQDDKVWRNVSSDGLKSPSFKEKGSELLQVAAHTSSKSQSVNHQFSSQDFSDYSGSYATERDTSLLDARKSQATDLDYYAVSSTSLSDEESEEHRAGLDADEIRLEDGETPDCCGCFRFSRLVR